MRPTKSIVLLLGLGGVAHAQPATDVEVPNVVIEQSSEASSSADDEALDLANIVQSAAKGVTTVQEAPAIVTVITADEIKERQFQNIEDLIDTVPGWEKVDLLNNNFNTTLVRGEVQAVQFLHDGLSLFDPFVNIAATNRSQPMELIKRVEMITGPGGVLWGSNSLLGILNVITKDAEDVDGIEIGGTLGSPFAPGSSQGDKNMARAYVMAGKSDLLGGKLKVFAHGSVETYQGATYNEPLLLFHDPLPQPNSANTYGALTQTDQQQSLLVVTDAKITYDKLQLRLFIPFGHQRNPLGLSGEPNRNTLPEDAHCQANPTDPTCFDPQNVSRQNGWQEFDRYGVLEYRTRFAEDKAGLTGKAYVEQFVRGFEPLQVLAPSSLIPGGLAFEANLTSYRAGGAIDGDIQLSHKLKIQYGAEAFNEWKPGDFTESHLLSPYDLTRLPVLCPREYDPTKMSIQPIPGCPLTFAFPADRTVLSGYVNPQWRPSKELIFDAGARLSVAPDSLGSLSYPVNTTVAATAVWNFIPNWHLKLNYAQGFRPPVFNDTTSNGEGLEITGNPNLKVETSDATQAEVNARIYKGERRIRELSFRVDASYTRLHNLIQVNAGNYENTPDRGIASVEFLGKLYVQGGHRIELGYTFMQVDDAGRGLIKTLPEHFFNLATVFNLVPGKLSATTNLKVSGAVEDANRLVEYRDVMNDSQGNPTNPVQVAATDLVLDRIPPIAELSVGVTYVPTPKLSIRATVYDALAGHYNQPDAFADYEPHLEYLPNPFPGFRAYISAMYQY